MILKNYFLILLIFLGFSGYSQEELEASVEGNVDDLPVREYTLTLREEQVNKAGKPVMGMTVNGQIPGPTLDFNEGEYAIIYVKNEMSVESSIHWHGMLLPNFYDGVPYLSTPPIEPGKTLKYEFAIKQNGTYWYHSHTMLQEQSGVFGPIVIQPKEKTLEYDKEQVLVLSDWTNEKPRDVMRFLKRGTEWYNIRKGTATPLNQVIARGALGAQFDFWRQRMESADIADIYYPAFLINGEDKIEYPDFKPGEKVRMRIIDGSASTSFWMAFGGPDPLLVSADGKDVVPVKKNKTFIAVAETYDFIVTIPENGKLEFKIMAQDGSGTATAYLGQGPIVAAPDVTKPDKIGMMQQMAKMKMKMGAPALKFRPGKDERYEMKEKWGMQMDNNLQMEGMKEMDMMNMDKSNMKNMEMKKDKMDGMQMDMKKDSMQMDRSNMVGMDTEKDSKMNEASEMEDMNKTNPTAGREVMDEADGMQGMAMFSQYNYDYLKSPEKTSYDPDVPVTEILLNLTGNMQRYIWSMNGVPLSEADKIKIKGDEVTRITFNNLTMMHHPMHLHGHFFRVINENGEYSPLKHTVNVPPMQKVTIEFYGNEYGDWFFHCHILYHLVGGMARIVSYDTPRDPRLEEYPVSKLLDETDQYYSYGMIDAASHMTTLNLISSNIRNQFSFRGEYGWNKNMEVEAAYDRYLYDYLTVFGGINVENGMEDSLDEITTTAIAGVRYLTPYLFTLDVRMDSKLRPQISLSRAISIFPRTILFGVYEYQADFGWVDELPQGDNFKKEVTWSTGIEYFLSKNFSLMGSYDNRFGAGGGLSLRF